MHFRGIIDCLGLLCDDVLVLFLFSLYFQNIFIVWVAVKMVCLKLQKRLAASVLDCGKKKIWLDPNEINDISVANSRMLFAHF
tara:strand:- start:667 stop:915 length:249 start_codon:yes stop_codon:yes gene_type:complete